MDKPSRYKPSSVRMALPVLSGSILRPGHAVKVFSPIGDPRGLESPPPSVYGIPLPFELAPTFFSDALSINRLSAEEARHLGDVLGFELTEDAGTEVDYIIKRFVCGIALAPWLPTWQQLAFRLREIISAIDKCVDAAKSVQRLAISAGEPIDSASKILPLDSAVKRYIVLQNVRDDLNVDLRHLRAVCEGDLKRIVAITSKKGPKKNLTFYLFAESLMQAAHDWGARVTLPSGEIKGTYGSNHTTPFFSFVRELLDTARTKGRFAIAESDLLDSEKQDALGLLAHTQKSKGAVLEYLRDARRALITLGAISGN